HRRRAQTPPRRGSRGRTPRPVRARGPLGRHRRTGHGPPPPHRPHRLHPLRHRAPPVEYPRRDPARTGRPLGTPHGRRRPAEPLHRRPTPGARRDHRMTTTLHAASLALAACLALTACETSPLATGQPTSTLDVAVDAPPQRAAPTQATRAADP